MNLQLLYELITVIVLYLFLPITALTYLVFRHKRQMAGVERILTSLNVDPSSRHMYRDEKPGYQFLWAATYASVVACIGLMLLFLGPELFPNKNGEFPSVSFGGEGGPEFPQEGSRLVFGMAFLGAYIWGLQYVFRRYALNDLTPDVYYNLSMRMILAALIALVIYNAYGVLGGENGVLSQRAGRFWPFCSGCFRNVAYVG